MSITPLKANDKVLVFFSSGLNYFGVVNDIIENKAHIKVYAHDKNMFFSVLAPDEDILGVSKPEIFLDIRSHIEKNKKICEQKLEFIFEDKNYKNQLFYFERYLEIIHSLRAWLML